MLFVPSRLAALPTLGGMTQDQASPVDVHLYQIAYSPASLAAVEPGYLVLDNLANPRPDWFEYWPIRDFLLTQPLDDAAFYGFFSPKFGSKTTLNHAQVTAFVQAAARQDQPQPADVVLFSPQPDMGCFFLNVFEQGETFDAGLIDCYEEFLKLVGFPAPPLRGLVMDSRQIVFSNFFVARPAFWRTWLALNEQMFAVCEGPDNTLKDGLTHVTSYPGSAQRKVFLQERVASLLLTVQPHQWRTKAHDPYGFGWSMSRFREHPHEAVISDALKIAFRDQGFPEYVQEFARIRKTFFGG